MTTNLIEELFSVLKRVRNDTRALVLTGNGQTFCAGGDIRDMQSIGLLESRPEPSVKTASSMKPGDLRSWRAAKKSWLITSG